MRCTIWRISLKLRITTDSLPVEIIVAWTVSGLRGLAWEPTQIHILITHVCDDDKDDDDDENDDGKRKRPTHQRPP